MPARLRASIPIALREPFRSQPTDPQERRTSDPKVVYVCPDHLETLSLKSARCPIDHNLLEKRALAANERVGWWCPMHPNVESDAAGKKCAQCGGDGMELVPRVIHYRPSGQVLAIPESAVVDTGKATLVYVERMPGMFDGVPVVLGPRCGDEYPVVKGLEAGQRVAAKGAFLIDAESRLNPSIAAAYFGAGRGYGGKPEIGSQPASAGEIGELCPVTKKPLGSMGPPVTIVIDGRTVMLCCESCEAAVRKNPAKYLGKSKRAAATDSGP
jgi:hypothetical protein